MVFLSRHRNLVACREHETAASLKQAMEARVARIRSNPQLYRPFPPVPEAQAWLELFKEDSLRYPILVVLGPSRAGKTEWAKSLFSKPLELKIGTLQFPDAMRHFQRDVHDGLLDDLRDFSFLLTSGEAAGQVRLVGRVWVNGWGDVCLPC